MAQKEMSKAERKAALKAAKAAAKAETKETNKNSQQVKEAEKSAETKETKKEEKKPQVAAQTVTNKEQKGETKEQKEQKKEQKPSTRKQKKDKTPTIIPEEVTEDKPKVSPEEKALKRATSLVGGITGAGIPVGSTASSVDGKAMLAFVMQQRYANNEELAKRYPEVYADINRTIDVVNLLALVDIRQDLFNRGERGELQLMIDANQLMPLQGMAEMLGIKLAPAKALPGGNDGQLAIDFNKSEVPEELAKDAGKTVTKVPELDPNKITTDEEIDEALTFLINKERNVATNIVNTVEWYRTLRGLKETNADKKLALDEMTVGDWMNEIFSRINPVSLLKGLGSSVYLYTSQTGSPCMAHSVLRNHLIKAGWSEEQVAETVRALINENFRLRQKDNQGMKPETDKAIIAVISNLGEEYIDKLFTDWGLNLEGVEESKKNQLENDRKIARMVLGSVKTNFFNKDESPTPDELRLKVGQIINLYRDPASRLAAYCQSSITSPVEKEYPEKKEEKPADEKKIKHMA